MGYSQVEKCLEQHRNLETHKQEGSERNEGIRVGQSPVKDTKDEARGKDIRVDLLKQKAGLQILFLLFQYFQFSLLPSWIGHIEYFLHPVHEILYLYAS